MSEDSVQTYHSAVPKLGLVRLYNVQCLARYKLQECHSGHMRDGLGSRADEMGACDEQAFSPVHERASARAGRHRHPAKRVPTLHRMFTERVKLSPS
jgi:hypothetical protein